MTKYFVSAQREAVEERRRLFAAQITPVYIITPSSLSCLHSQSSKGKNDQRTDKENKKVTTTIRRSNETYVFKGSLITTTTTTTTKQTSKKPDNQPIYLAEHWSTSTTEVGDGMGVGGRGTYSIKKRSSEATIL